MIRVYGAIRPIKAIAVSGGIDSMAALNFVHRNNPDVTALYFDHGTEHGSVAKAFVQEYCQEHRIAIIVGNISGSKPDEHSWEEHWRIQRYAFLHSFKGLVATAHHLDDLAETYLWGCAHGRPRFIHYRQPAANGLTNIVRPFLLTPKEEFKNWCARHQVPWVDDPSNSDVCHTRNRIRHNVVPEILKVNPGFLTVVKKQWLTEEQSRSHEQAQ